MGKKGRWERKMREGRVTSANCAHTDMISHRSQDNTYIHQHPHNTDEYSCREDGGTYQWDLIYLIISQYITVYHSISQYITVYHSILQYITVYYSIPQYTTVYPISQYPTVHHSTSQYITACHSTPVYMPLSCSQAAAMLTHQTEWLVFFLNDNSHQYQQRTGPSS